MITDPEKIEQESFAIIQRELSRAIPADERPTVYRVIHTTADFEFADILEFHPDAVTAGLAALARGCRIYADTAMICAGTNRRRLGALRSEIYTLVDDAHVARQAKDSGITRSMAAIERAAADADTRVFVIGNAPTALMTLRQLIVEGRSRPELVIGVPVGFVGAAESKDAIWNTEVPSIITRGRKGGSTVAVAILNSLLYQV